MKELFRLSYDYCPVEREMSLTISTHSNMWRCPADAVEFEELARRMPEGFTVERVGRKLIVNTGQTDTYLHIESDDEWEVEAHGYRCCVVAETVTPRYKGYRRIKPKIHIKNMAAHFNVGWRHMDENGALDRSIG